MTFCASLKNISPIHTKIDAAQGKVISNAHTKFDLNRKQHLLTGIFLLI